MTMIQTIKKRNKELGLSISSIFLRFDIDTKTINKTFVDENILHNSICSVLKSLDLTLSISNNNA